MEMPVEMRRPRDLGLIYYLCPPQLTVDMVEITALQSKGFCFFFFFNKSYDN